MQSDFYRNPRLFPGYSEICVQFLPVLVGRTVRIEALGGSEESRRKTMLRIAADVIWLAFCLLLVKYGFELVASIYTRGLISAAMRMPMYLVYLSLPVSQLAVSLRIIGELWRTVKEYRNGAAEPVEGGGEA